MADYEQPPDTCACGSVAYTQVIERPTGVKGFILIEGGCRGWGFENYYKNKVIQ